MFFLVAAKVLSAVLAVYQSARATTRTLNSSSGKCLPYVRTYDERTTDIQTAVDIKCGARPNYSFSISVSVIVVGPSECQLLYM